MPSRFEQLTPLSPLPRKSASRFDTANIPFNIDTPTTESLEAINRYNERLLEVGVNPPKSKMVLGTVNRVLDVLRTGEYAVGGILAGEGAIKGIQEKISPSDVFGITPDEETSFWGLLKQPKFYGALAVDILFDPVTYLTFGFGSGAKLSVGAATKILNRSGSSLLKRATEQFGEDSARKMLATTIMREGGENYLKSGGLKFMGQQFIPRKIVQAPFRGVDWAIEKTPFVGWGYMKTKDTLAKAFKPFASIDELPAQLGGDGRFEEEVLKTQKGIRGKTAREMEYLSALAKEARKAGVKNPGEVITSMVEFDFRTGNKVLDDMADYMQESLKGFGFAEQKRGILGEAVQVHIPGYMRHFLTKEGREFLTTRGKTVQEEFLNNVKDFRVKAPFAKERKLKAFTTETGERFIGNMKTLGLEKVVRKEAVSDIHQALQITLDDLGLKIHDIRGDISDLVEKANTVFQTKAVEDFIPLIADKVHRGNIPDIVRAFKNMIPKLDIGQMRAIAHEKSLAAKITKDITEEQAEAMLARAQKLFEATSDDLRIVNLALEKFGKENFGKLLKKPAKMISKTTGKIADEKLAGLVKEIQALKKVATNNLLKEGDVQDFLTILFHEFDKNPVGVKKFLTGIGVREQRLFGLFDKMKEARKVAQKELEELPERKIFFQDKEGRKLLEQRATINEINNLYKEKYGVQLFEPDAFKSFGQRTAEHIRATQMYDFFQNLVDERIAIRAPILPQLQRTKRGLAVSHRVTEETMINGVKMVRTKVPQMEGFLVAEPIAKHLDMVHGMMTREDVSKGLLKLYDGALNIWKGSVTGWFPAFHSRNMIGGMFNNWLAGIWNPKWYKFAEDVIRGKDIVFTAPLGQTITGKQILREVEDFGVTGAPGMIDIMRDVEEMVKIGAKSKSKQIMNYPRIAMEAVEDRLRIPLYLYRRINKGDTPAQAAKEVFKYHFDYAPEAFTAFERNVMKRLIPFYTWTKGNVPLQIQELMKQPGKFASLEKMRREIDNASSATASEDESVLPTWMKEMFLFRLPGESKDGLPRYLQLDLPLEDINKLPFTESGRREIIALLSPFLKYPIERIANRNLYFGSEIYNADVPREYQTAKAIEALKFLPEPVKDYLNFKETQIKNAFTGQLETRYEMDAIKLHVIRSILAGRFYSTIGSATDNELDVWMKLSRMLGGVPIRTVNIEEEKYRRVKEQEILSREVVNYLRRRGVIESGDKPFPTGFN